MRQVRHDGRRQTKKIEGTQESTREEYIQSWNGLTNDEILADYIINIYNLSSLQTEKYKDLRLSIITTMMALGSLIVLILF
jgi:hypothetical protein